MAEDNQNVNSETSSSESLRKAVIACFEEAQKTQKITVDSIKTHLEPVFTSEGYREDIEEAKTQSILVIRLDEIGDNVLNSGFIRELRRNYPKAYITLIVNPIVAPLMELCPYVNEVIAFSVSNIKNLMERFNRVASLCYNRLWKRKYTLAFVCRWDVDGNRYANFLAYFSGAKERIGYSCNINPLKKHFDPYVDELLTTPVVNPIEIIHEVSRNLYLLKAKNLRVEDDSLEVWYGEDDYFRMKKILSNFAKGRKIIAVSSGSNWLHKDYPPEKFIVALKKIQSPDICFALIGGKSEKKFSEYLYKNLSENLSESTIDLTGETTLRETAALLSLCSMYIGMDTGSKHIAAALKLPIIEINCSPLTLKPFPMLLVDRCAPWKTPFIIVRPKKPLPPCDKSNPWGGCEKVGVCHCISGVDPDDVVWAYEKLSAIRT